MYTGTLHASLASCYILCRGFTLACLDSPTRIVGDPLLVGGLILTALPLLALEGGVHLGNFRVEEGSLTERDLEGPVLGVNNDCEVWELIDIG